MDNDKQTIGNSLLSFVFLLIVPAILSFIISFFFNIYGKYTPEINSYYGQGFGYCLGALFQLSCYMTGILKRPFMVVVERIKELFLNRVVSWKFAFKCYFDHLITNGINFWIYLLITTITIIYGIDGIIKLVEIHLVK